MFRKTAAAVFFLLTSTSQAFAYNAQTTHPALTGEILGFVGGFTAEERSWIIEGSKLEDFAPRWINHFYDPINDTGWTGAKAGNIPAETLRTMASIGTTEPLSAISWIKGCNTQSAYFANGGNRAWDTALSYYVNGNIKEAYITLGHILHILEDLSVPDHTRDDTHAQNLGGDDGSPYEQYTAKYGPENIGSLGIGASLRSSGASIPSFGSPEEYLKAMAIYSNKYFFSKDTIKDPRYPNPKISSENDSFAYGKDESGTEFPMTEVKIERDSNGVDNRMHRLSSKETSYPILDSYFLRLSKQAVLNGAGLVALFKRQAEDAKTNQEFFVDDRHTLAKIACDTGDLASKFNAMGLISYIGQSVGSAMGQVANTAGSIWNYLAGLFKRSTPQPTEIASTEETNPPAAPNIKNSATRNTDPLTPPPLPPPPKPTTPKATTTLPAAPTSTVPAIPTTTATSTKAKSLKLAVGTPPLPPPPNPTQGSTAGGGGVVGVQPNPIQPATSSEPQATTSPVSATNNILISEVLFNADGSDAGKEFIELYNPSDSAKDLDGYSLKYIVENSTTTHSLATIRATTSEISIIPPHGFLLFGFGGYDPQNYGGKTADIIRTTSIPNGEDAHNAPQKIKLSFFDETKQEIDSVIYDKNSIMAPGESLERLAFDGVCKSATGSGEFLGNGCSAGEKQFESKNIPRPQNSTSFPEPRQAPTIPTPLEGVSSIANYFPDTLKINFAWKDSFDFRGSFADITYSLFDTSSTTPLLVSTSTATSTEINIGEVGRSYSHSIIAEDRDGMPSATISVSTEVPGFADKIFFYRDPRASSTSDNILLELRYSNRQFIPRILSNGLGWRGLLFYLDRMPNSQNGTILFGRNYSPQNNDGVIFVTARGPALFGLSPENSKGFGPGLYNFSFLLPEEDGRLVLGATLPAGTTSTDYASVAYYDAINTGGIAFPAGENDFGLIATDARKIMFSETPPEQTSPTKPESFSVNFNDNLLKLNLSWATSTDADSPDSEITYETNISTSTEFSSSTWVSSEKNAFASVSVAFGNDYLLGVRAKDDFGNTSEANTVNWSFPADSRPPAEPIIGYFRTDSCARTAKQITPPANIKIKTVEFSASCFNGNCDPPNDFAIYDENKTSLLSHSDGASRFGYPDPIHVIDTFSDENSITLLASTTYSVIPRSSNGDCGIGGTEEQSKFIITGSQP